jgi:hypothetical protein
MGNADSARCRRNDNDGGVGQQKLNAAYAARKGWMGQPRTASPHARVAILMV